MSDQVLITGATGFLGRNLAERLLADHSEVTIVQRDGSTSGDIAAELEKRGAVVERYSDSAGLRDIVQRVQPATVFHLATLYTRQHTPDTIDGLLDANVALGTHLLESLVGSTATVVSALSFFQYRGGEYAPYSLYSAFKEAFAVVSGYYRDVAKVDVREVVLYDTYGPGDSRDKLVPHIVAAFANGHELQLGPSAQLMNLLYVDDVIAGLRVAAGGDGRSRSAIRSSEPISVGDIVATMTKVTGRTISLNFAEDRSVSDLPLVSNDWAVPAGWTPETDLETGLNTVWASR